MPDKLSVVLDTNVVLDWLLFDDPRIADLAGRIKRAELRWVACPAIRREFAHMLGHASLARWPADREQALAVFDLHATLLPDPPPAGARGLRCADVDDQVFLDLALAHEAQLFTRDRALLKLARRSRLRGLSISTP